MLRRPRSNELIRITASVVVMTVTFAGTSAGASASPPPDADRVVATGARAERMSRTVIDAAPARSTVASATGVEPTGEFSGRPGGGLAARGLVLPSDGTGTIRSTSGVDVALPDHLDTRRVQLSSDGLAVYEADRRSGVSAVVAATPSSASIQLVIPSSRAATRYAFELGGAKPILNGDGSVTLLRSTAGPGTRFDEAREETVAVGAVGVPWARDARGKAVPTRFEVQGQRIVQVVELDQASAFPVVADPDLIFFAKCGAAVLMFVAENAGVAAKFWRVFKSRKAFARLMKGLKGMKTRTKVKYVARRLGMEASKLSGIHDLVQRCTP